MPRAGAHIVSDLPRDRLCRIACERCGRAGAYRRETLAARSGDIGVAPRADRASDRQVAVDAAIPHNHGSYVP
jgi:hypothetical protein